MVTRNDSNVIEIEIYFSLRSTVHQHCVECHYCGQQTGDQKNFVLIYLTKMHLFDVHLLPSNIPKSILSHFRARKLLLYNE
jgi:hypothetical protein